MVLADYRVAVAFATFYVVSVVFSWFLGVSRGEGRSYELLTREVDNSVALRKELLKAQMDLIEARCELAERSRTAKRSGELFPDPFESVS